MKNGQSGGAIAQHLAKDCASLKEDGVEVPSPLKRGGNRNGRHEPVSTARLAPNPFAVGFDSLSEHISVGMSQAPWRCLVRPSMVRPTKWAGLWVANSGVGGSPTTPQGDVVAKSSDIDCRR